MSDLAWLSTIGMFALVIGTLPSMKAMISSRNDLSAFSLIGASGIFAGQTIFVGYFGYIGDWLTTILELPLCAFWLIVIILKARKIQINKSNPIKENK